LTHPLLRGGTDFMLLGSFLTQLGSLWIAQILSTWLVKRELQGFRNIVSVETISATDKT